MENQAFEVAFDRSRQFDQKRIAVILGAAQCFHESGYANTTLDAIAKRLSVTKKALYHYIDSKQEILFEIFAVWLDSHEAAISTAEAADTTAEQKLAVYVTDYIARVLKDLAPMDRIAGEISLLADEQQSTINQRRKINDRRVRAIIEQGIATGDFQACNSRIAVYNLHGAIDWFFKWYRDGGDLTREEAIAEMLNIYLAGLRVNAVS